MRVLLACEESQTVLAELRSIGVEAYSCDLQDCSGSYPEYHLKKDVLTILEDDWDAVIAFPPCTHLCVSGARWWPEKRTDGRQQFGIDFFMKFVNCANRWAIENPIGIMSRIFRKPDQIIQPWQFGHGEVKATCLWLGGFPQLIPTSIVQGRDARVHKMPPSKDRARLRSKTYQGIAKAMASQWFEQTN